jgi:chromate reductase
MISNKHVLIINGSASAKSSNEKLITIISDLLKNDFAVTVFDQLKALPHFDPELAISNPPEPVIAFRKLIEDADAVIICTPEYIFSIPSGLKNAIEWCVATTVFSDKPVGLITASADGSKGHVQLQLIMKTIMGTFTEQTTLLINGIKSKINSNGEINDAYTENKIKQFIKDFSSLVENSFRHE